MALTLAQLRTLVWDWTDDPNGSYFTQSTLNIRLNLAQRELQKKLISANKEYYLKCVKTDMVIAQAIYALPDDFMQVIRLEWYIPGAVTTSKSSWIFPMTPNQKNLSAPVNGDPQFYTFQKNNIVLYPTPTRVLEMHLEYSYNVTDMSADADEPDAPEQFHEYIAILATRDCLIKDGKPLDPIKSKMDQYEVLLKQIADQRQADSSRMVVQTQADAFGSGWSY